MDCLTNFSSSQINETQNQNEVKSCFISYPHLEELSNLVQLDADLFSMRKTGDTPWKRNSHDLWQSDKADYSTEENIPEVACMQWSGTSENNKNTVNWRCQSTEWKAPACEVLCEHYARLWFRKCGKFHCLPAHQSVSLPSLLPESQFCSAGNNSCAWSKERPTDQIPS